MKTRVRIISFSVLQNAISIRILCESVQGIADEPRDEKKRVNLEDLSFEAKIKSINIQRGGTNILIRTRKNRYIAGRLFDLMGRETIEFSISEAVDGKIYRLLLEASKKTGKSEEDLLYRLTTFRDKDGKEIPGKRLIDDLSENQKSVILKKLGLLLKGEKDVRSPEINF